MEVVRIVVKEGMTLVTIGAFFGTVAAFLLTRVLKAILSEVGEFTPGIYLGVLAVVAAVSVLACVLPAFRASRVDPAISLRAE